MIDKMKIFDSLLEFLAKCYEILLRLYLEVNNKNSFIIKNLFLLF